MSQPQLISDTFEQGVLEKVRRSQGQCEKEVGPNRVTLAFSNTSTLPLREVISTVDELRNGMDASFITAVLYLRVLFG